MTKILSLHRFQVPENCKWSIIAEAAGNVGEQTINGQFTFLEDGKNIPLKFQGNYVVVPRFCNYFCRQNECSV
jgi:hypothetical protein